MSINVVCASLVVLMLLGVSIVILVSRLSTTPKRELLYRGVLKPVTKKPQVDQYRAKWTSVKPTCSFRRRPTKREILNSTKDWQKAVAGNTEAYIRRAYLDERHMSGTLPWVRVLGIVIGSTEVLAWCHLWVEGIEIPMISEANLRQVHKIGAERLTNISALVISCQLRPYMPLPTHVSVTLTSSCIKYTNYLPLVGHDEPGSQACKMEFGLCASIQWFEYEDGHFPEWAEFYRLMGVEKISLYTIDFYLETRLLSRYVKSDYLEIIQIEKPDSFPREITFDVLLSLKNFALNDCFYRNLYRYCHIVQVHLDEFIVPKKGVQNFTALLKILNEKYYVKPQEVSYKFFNSFFHVGVINQPNSTTYLRTVANIMRTEPMHSAFGARSIVRSSFCLAFHNFHCVLSVASFLGELGTKVNPELASLNVYRSCDEFLRNEECRYKNMFIRNDETMQNFKVGLSKAVKQMIK